MTYDSRGDQCSSPFGRWLGTKYGLAAFGLGLLWGIVPAWAQASPKLPSSSGPSMAQSTLPLAERGVSRVVSEIAAKAVVGHGIQIMSTLTSAMMVFGRELALTEPLFRSPQSFPVPSPAQGTIAQGTIAQGTIAQGTIAQETIAQGTIAQETRSPPLNPASRVTSFLGQGSQVILNGRPRSIAWMQWQVGQTIRLGLSDVMASQQLGLELLSSRTPSLQPVQWYPVGGRSQFNLATRQSSSHRFLDVTDLAQAYGWQIQGEGNRLLINTPLGQITDLQQEGAQGDRIVVQFKAPVPWQLSQTPQEWVLTVDSPAPPQILDRFRPMVAPSPSPVPLPGVDINEGEGIPTPRPTPALLPLRVESSGNQTKIRAATVPGRSPRVIASAGNRLVVELLPEALPNRDIQWANSIRWRQQYLSLENSRFPVVWLTLNPRRGTLSGVTLRPIGSTPNTMTGTSPLLTMAPLWQATAAINGGFFNRNNQLPLGALRRDGQWLSGPILNRGAIAWNDQGQMIMARLNLTETLVLPTAERLPINLLNTAYIQAGIARYTPSWGSHYTPLSNNERVVIVQQNQVLSQMDQLMAGQGAIPIPLDGYLLVFRVQTALADRLFPGTPLRLESATTPVDFNRYPHILGAGPLLIQNRQIVLNAKAEGFGEAFARQAAIRSVIATNAQGEILLIAIHPRVGGSGPTLVETARLMQQLGVVNALNLDGGSSTSLYLGGQLLDRSPVTAARVHNGLGIFWQP